ncbi:MAG: hypothetical protein KGS61_05175 [Verrucomicrobia bacterium]|nr:hypothetical protein [Verrucomicrobiota bacterium]
MRLNYIAGAGGSVVLDGQSIGRGGEGQIMPVSGSGTLVAKIFHQPTLERWWKVWLIMGKPAPPANGHCPVAWPVECLFTHEAKPQFAGYLMPRIAAAQPVFMYYTHDLRLIRCPAFTYAYLVRAARNLSAAVGMVHGRGFAIGDLNESNILVREDALVTLIDSDSWQVRDTERGITYRCPVGKGEFIPPELQGRNLADVDRCPHHDHFALAVLIWKLLGEGCHPFDGVFHGGGDPPPLEARIVSGVLPWRDRSGLWSPKPGAVFFGLLHPVLQDLFYRAFSAGHREPRLRPDAAAWQDGLRRAEADLQTCPRNPRHRHWGTRCVWCERTTLLGGIDPFPAGSSQPAQRGTSPGRNGRRNGTAGKQAVPVPQVAAAAAATAPPATPQPLVQLLNDIHGLCRQASARLTKHPFMVLGTAAILILIVEAAAFLIVSFLRSAGRLPQP